MNRWKWECFPLPLLSGRHDGRRILLPVAVFRSENPTDLTFVRATALLDTGATSSAIGPGIVNKLALSPHAKRPLMVATEERQVDFFLFRIGLFDSTKSESPSSFGFPFVFAETEGFKMRDSPTFNVILGMDVMAQCDLQISRNGSWKLSYG